MATTLENEEVKIKPTITTLECEEMLNEALAYMAKNSLKQARIMNKQFYDVLRILQRMPKIGIKYKKGMRRIKLGKFRYFIYYKEKETEIEIVGIWHTSRGTEFINH